MLQPHPLPTKLLSNIKSNPTIVIANADKGLGPVGVNKEQYVTWGLQHLQDTNTYTLLTQHEALISATQLYHQIFQWTRDHRHTLDDDTVNYIRRHIEKTRTDPFGYFYLLIKLHKQPISTRPVCSDCASLPHALGKWIDKQLQPIVQKQPTYFKNSSDLKSLLDTPSTCIFTYDAISMYTNIDTSICLDRLCSFLTNNNTA